VPFTLIKGTCHLVDKTKAGKLVGFAPDGDSLAFKPDKASLLDRLEILDKPYKLTAINSVQLRFEGIDVLELHFRGKSGPERRQPQPLAEESRDFLTGKFGLNPVPYSPPRLIKVKPSVVRDGAQGFILSRALDVHGRPVSFVYVGSPAPRKDGATVVLDGPLLRKSLNCKSLTAGEAYPLGEPEGGCGSRRHNQQDVISPGGGQCSAVGAKISNRGDDGSHSPHNKGEDTRGGSPSEGGPVAGAGDAGAGDVSVAADSSAFSVVGLSPESVAVA
jgi:hypothetical protein